MPRRREELVVCQICKKQKRLSQVMPAELVRESVVKTIKKKYPDWSPSGFVCFPDLNHFRTEYVRESLETEKGELTTIEKEVVNSLEEQELLSKNINAEFDHRLTSGEKWADKVADFGGSWRFVLIFGSVLFVWVGINSAVLLWRPFDPFPFILLNLVLSCLAAIQAPVIMMSQNRQETKDRLRSEHDYRINLRAELEIRHLHAKLDELMSHQWQRLMEIQEIQMELMEQLVPGLGNREQSE
jgi:uncharacterized membrane protein